LIKNNNKKFMDSKIYCKMSIKIFLPQFFV
jgi:hypothetical protein